jgi:hypothetical protein
MKIKVGCLGWNGWPKWFSCTYHGRGEVCHWNPLGKKDEWVFFFSLFRYVFYIAGRDNE